MSAKAGDVIIVESKGWSYILTHQALMCVIYYCLGLFSAPYFWSLMR